MKRRNFLSLSGAFALSPVAGKLSKATNRDETLPDISDGRKKIKKIAGFTPEELHEVYRSFLFEDFLPFMEKHVIDHEPGGFLWNTDRSGRNITTKP